MDQVEELLEPEIISRILDGQKLLFEKIIRRYNSTLYKVGRSYGFDHDETLVLMQETFINTYTGLGNFEGITGLKLRIIHIMLNNCNKKQQEAGHKREAMEGVNNRSKPLSFVPGRDAKYHHRNNELAKVIEQALSQIRPDYRMVLSLRAISGLSVAETAELLHISESDVKVRFSRAKAMLGREIEKACSLSDIFEFDLKYCDTIVKNVMKKIYEL